MFRQGDVLIVPVSKLPENLKEVDPKNGLLILAEGEATGHHHSIVANQAKLLQDLHGALFLTLSEKTVLRHQEHEKIDLPAGDYLVIRQRVYTPEEIKNVAD